MFVCSCVWGRDAVVVVVCTENVNTMIDGAETARESLAFLAPRIFLRSLHGATTMSPTGPSSGYLALSLYLASHSPLLALFEYSIQRQCLSSSLRNSFSMYSKNTFTRWSARVISYLMEDFQNSFLLFFF